MPGSETAPAKRAFLRTWAAVSGGVCALTLVIGIAAIALVGSSGPSVNPNGVCQGGPQIGVSGTYVGNGNWTFPCVFGGTATEHLGAP
jgi:hypothetical protein